MENSKKTSADIARSTLLFLLRRRWYYILLGLFLAGAYYYVRRDNVAMPTREYITTYKVKYANTGDYDIVSSKKRLHWEMQNPYSIAIAKKYFESTKIIAEAGAQINYTVSYRHKGIDIYPNRPVEVRFLSPQVTDFDAWSMTVDLDSLGATFKNLKGTFRGKAIPQTKDFHLPYNVVSESPLGKMIIKKLKVDSLIKDIKLTKISEVAAQNKYDDKMKRYTGGNNLIELFLTSDCSRTFAHDLFRAMGTAYERYAYNDYTKELKTYLAQLKQAKEELKSGHFTLDSLVQLPQLKASSVEKAIEHIEELEADAAANALILAQNDIVEVLDDNYIRSPKQTINPRKYLPYISFLIAVITPLLLLLLECFARGWVLSSWTLPEQWQAKGKIIRYSSQAKDLDLYIFKRSIKEALASAKGQTLIIGESYDSELKALLKQVSEELNFSLSKYQRGQELAVPQEQGDKARIIIAKTADALELQEQMQGSLGFALKAFKSSHQELDKLAESCQHLGIEPIIFWSNRI